MKEIPEAHLKYETPEGLASLIKSKDFDKLVIAIARRIDQMKSMGPRNPIYLPENNEMAMEWEERKT